MKLVIEINMDGAAFEDNGDNGREVARILRRLSDIVDDSDLGPDPITSEPTVDNLRDSNGNTCGKVTVSL